MTTATCIRCNGEINVETSLATAVGPRHGVCPPPEVEFFPERVCDKHKRVAPTCSDCQERHYLIDGKKEVGGFPIVSVTTVLSEIGDRFGQAAWWGQGVGVKGYHDLLTSGTVDMRIEPDDVVTALTKNQLTVNHQRDDAAASGTSVHAHAEKWATTGTMPVPEDAAGDRERGCLEALVSFIETEKPEPLHAEVLVGSRAFGYAGTYDLEARLSNGVGVLDYKSKSTVPKGKKRTAYEQNHLQLRGYEDARVEMGMAPTDFQAVVNLYPDGTYALVEGRATSEQWQAAIRAYRALTALRDALKQAA